MTHSLVAAPPNANVVTPALTDAERTQIVLDGLRANAPIASVLVACSWWLLLAPRLTGGRAAGAVSGGAILTGLAVVAIRPDRWLPNGAIWLGLAISAAAFGVALSAPTGWAGATTAASYVCVSWTVLAVATAVVRDSRVPNLLLLLLIASVLVEFGESWLAWWGGENAGAALVGTFYWWNPFAAFMLSGTVVAFSIWLRRTGMVAVLGLFGWLLGSIAMIYSTSRATDACFTVAVVVVCLAHIGSRRLAGLRRVAIGLAVSVAGIFAIAGPPFFPHRVLPFAATEARTAGQSLSRNGGYRVDFWRDAIGVFHRHPLVGGGYHSLAMESFGHAPRTWPLSPLAHSGYLQALSDGGLLLGVPFLIGCACLSWYVVAALVNAVRHRDFSTAGLAIPLTLGALLAHSAIDFDWSFAADFTIVAVLAGLVAGARWSKPSGQTTARSSRVTAAVMLAGVALLVVAAVTARGGDEKQSLPIGPVSNAAVAPASQGM